MIAGCGILLSIASRVFYVYEDPRIAQVEACFAGANCGGCGFAGCSAAAAAVVHGKTKPSVCVVGGMESAQKAAAVMGMEVGSLEPLKSFNPCTGGDRAENKFFYIGVATCQAEAALFSGKRTCEVGCIGHGDCVRACMFDAIAVGPDGFPIVDEEKCVGCGACARACPKNLLKISTPSERLLHFNQRGDCLAPCRQTCPAEIDIPLYIHQIRTGDYAGAVNTIRERNPLLLACGRVCPHPCELNCRRGVADEPVSINQLKRFAADFEMTSGRRLPIRVAPDTGKRIAVIGGGPAGLTCAYFLRRLGRYGIPEYRLPKQVLDWEIESILNLGVEVRTGVRIGVDLQLESLRTDGYDAVFMGIGAWKDSKLAVPGEELQGCYTGIDFLARLASGEKLDIKPVAAVIGGGNTAIDCTRNLLRSGARKVYLVYRRTRKEMPANEVEVEAAEHPVRVVGNDQGLVTHLEYLRMELGEPDASGRRRPVPVKGSETLLPTDMVISAIGQAPDVSFAASAELKTTRWSTIESDPATLQTNIPFLFVAGDVATGPSLVVEAIGGGRRAARSIHQFVTGRPVEAEPNELRKNLLTETIFDQVPGIVTRPRAKMVELPAAERIRSFEEVDQVLTEEAARRESDRCLYCCLTCYNPDATAPDTDRNSAALAAAERHTQAA
ncbi:MAG: FAD-dependent oxidoreductase [Desulfobacterales bacterium]|nr:FAD-dependent oxidoreductase [Desulfobacterales bacterium]